MSFKTASVNSKVRDGTPTKASHRCENHGGCPYCLSNRMHKYKKDTTNLKDE